MPRSSSHSVSDSYFATMSQMQEAVSNRAYELAAQLVRDNLRQIPAWVKKACQEYGSFDIPSIPALQQGGTVLALVGDDEGLAEMRQIIASVPELTPWAEVVEQHHQDRRLFKVILKTLTEHPGCLQTEVKSLIGEADGHRVANLISYLEKYGKITRAKIKRTYRLSPTGCRDSPASVPPG